MFPCRQLQPLLQPSFLRPSSLRRRNPVGSAVISASGRGAAAAVLQHWLLPGAQPLRLRSSPASIQYCQSDSRLQWWWAVMVVVRGSLCERSGTGSQSGCCAAAAWPLLLPSVGGSCPASKHHSACVLMDELLCVFSFSTCCAGACLRGARGVVRWNKFCSGRLTDSWCALMLKGAPTLCSPLQPMEIFVDDEAKLTLHGLVQHYIMLQVR